jgi:salicylate hydroxylase
VFNSRVTLVGDAAHAHGGAFAAGGSLALDDAFALGLAFKHFFESQPGGAEGPISSSGVEKALQLYSKTRQPHTDRLLRIVHSQVDSKPTGSGSAEGEDAKLIERIRNRPNTEWLSEHDVEAAFKKVVEDMGRDGGARQGKGSKL